MNIGAQKQRIIQFVFIGAALILVCRAAYCN